MKKFILLFVLVMTANVVKAQTEFTDKKYPVYCEVMGYNSWGFGKIKARLDMGRTNPSKQDYEYIYEGGKKKKFNTIMEVLDYMSKRGWKLHSTYVVAEGMSRQNVMHFLMEKYVSSDEEIDDNLDLKDED